MMDFFCIEDNYKKNNKYDSKLLFGNLKTQVDISIVIPVYKRYVCINNAIDSVIQQNTNYIYEIIIVDDDDDFNNKKILDIVNKYDPRDILYYKNSKNLGLVGNFNRCIELANAKWLLILHDDDILNENYIEEMLNIIKSREDISGLACLHHDIDENNQIRYNRSDYETKKIKEVKNFDFYIDTPISIVGLLMNKEAAIKIGGFNEMWGMSCDCVFELNLQRIGKVFLYEKCLFFYRVAYNESMHHDTLKNFVEIAVKLNDFLHRKNGIPEAIHNWHRNVVAYHYEKAAKSSWNQSIDFRPLNEKLNIKPVSKLDLIIYKIVYKLYKIWMW